jgi:aryl-alcohol dehydrogenase-like predicted oxidoreductase
MDYAFSQGVNFFDTAELYPVPAQKERYAETEKIMGNWFRISGRRKEVVLASKIAGPAPFTEFIRTTGFHPGAIQEAVEGSLRRLQTDYIDLYQLHWPERSTNYFGQRGYRPDPGESWKDNIHEVLRTLGGLVQAGKVRHVGLSNETPWGVMRFLEEARADAGLPRMITIQNPYSLLNRLFEVGLSEISMRSDIGLLAYSPLGFGTLSGKYLGGKKPENARVTLFPNYNRYSNPRAVEATAAYAEIAGRHGLSLAQMALAFVNSRPFLTSNIIGATSMDQLKENIGSIKTTLGSEVLGEIEQVHSAIPNPAP